MIDVRPATPADAGLLARITAAGFYDDPVMSWVLRDDDRRLAQLIIGFGKLIAETVPAGGVVHLADDASAAFWRDPSYRHDRTAADRAQSGGGDLAETWTADEMERMTIMGDLMREAHPHEPHWYLNVVSTVPERQGQGFGAAVLQPVLQRCDADGMPAYLESTNPRNRTLYKRLGFVETGEILLPDGPSMMQMWRGPQG